MAKVPKVPFIVDTTAPTNPKLVRELRDIATCALTANGKSLRDWAKDCHAASVAIVRHPDMAANARVARGWHPNVASQHSWVVIGDVYAKSPLIIDATLWSYDGRGPSIIIGHAKPGDVTSVFGHKPHGYGSIWEYGRPDPKMSGTPRFALTPPKDGWSPKAARFLKEVGKLGIWGWGSLASNFPVGEWPAAEIIRAMYDDERLQALIPIDKLGMLTDLNPGRLYLRGPDRTVGMRRRQAKRLREMAGGRLMTTKRKPRPLGENQVSLLKSLVNHGSWHDRAGWTWDGVGSTIRMMNRLVARGLVDATPVVPARVSHSLAGNPVAMLYKINAAGRRAIKEADGK